MICFFLGMEFHEELHNLGTKEGLKGRKLSKAIESFAWDITVLKVSTENTLPCGSCEQIMGCINYSQLLSIIVCI